MKNSLRIAKGKTVRDIFLKMVPAVFLLMLASCSLIPGSLTSRFGGNSAAELPEDTAVLVPVVRGNISSTISFVGNLRYNQSADLTWKTGGVIDSVNVKVGDKVKKGDILAVLATDSLTPSVIIAEKNMIDRREALEDVIGSGSARMDAYSKLTEKEAALTKAKLEQEALYYPRSTRQEMELAWDTLALAHLNFNYAKQDYDHLVAINESWEGNEPDKTLRFFGRKVRVGGDNRSGRERKFEEYVSAYNNYVSAYEKYLWVAGQPKAVDYAIAEGNVQVAQLEYDKALEEYLSYDTMPREKDVHAAEVSLNSAETSYNQRFIIAQFDGTVTSVSAIKDYYVVRGDAAVRVDDMSRIFVPISIPELDLNSVAVGTPVSISVDAVSGRKYSGHIYDISDASNSSGTMTVFSGMVLVDDPDERLFAGMTAEVSLPQNEKTNVILIPNSAITYADGKPTVVIADGGAGQKTEIQLGTVSDNVSEVTSGNLKEGMQLAVSSVSANALRELGLDPKEYLDGPEGMPPMGTGSGPRPAEGFQRPPAAESRPVNTEMPANTAVPTDTAAAASPEKPEDEAAADDARKVPPSGQDGRPSGAPDGSQRPPDGEGRFPGPPPGQFPGAGEDGQHRRPPDGQRPPRDPNGGPPGGPNGGRPPEGSAAPTPAPDSKATGKGQIVSQDND